MECAFWKCSCSKTVKHIDRNWCFLNSPDYNFWYSCLTFAKKKREMKKKNSNFFGSKFFFGIFSEIFLRFKSTQKAIFKKRNFFFKKIQKKFYDTNFYFFQIEIFFISHFFFAKVRFECQMVDSCEDIGVSFDSI